MKTLKFLLILTLLFSCKKEYSGFYNVSGKVEFDNGLLAENSQVYLNDELKATTDADGKFIINDIEAGKYILKISGTDHTNSYSELETEIDLRNDDLNLTNLLLPVPVSLFEPIDVTTNSVSLAWSRSGSDDFREYHIYIHHTGGIDEDTGTLLKISTDVNDTNLTVNAGDFWWAGSTLSPDETYYFRVFVMNAYGRKSGSNILEVTTDLWDNEDEFTNNYNIELESSFAAQGNLNGIAWDGDYFWMLYFEVVGGDNIIVTVVKYDSGSGTTLDTIVFDDSNYFPEGISWDGTYIWISFGTHIKSVDIENEMFDKTYYAGEVTVDLAWDNEDLLLLDIWNKVTFINPINGNISQQFNTPFIDIGYSGEKGIAYRTGEIWIINVWHHQICILDDSGNHIGIAEVDFLQDGFNSNGHRIPMCFMNDKLIIALDSQVRIYTIEQID